MRYCKRCLYPENHPLNITFNRDGICSGCQVHEEKDSLNWTERGQKLKNILNAFKSSSKKRYDCIIPVSGARDSYFIVHTIKNVYGMNPLLVTYNKQYNTQAGIRNLAYLKTLLSCDLITMTVSPESVKKITRATIKKLGSIYWHCLAGQTVFPVQMAVKLKVPLIIWGAHQGCDQVGMFSHLDEVEMTRKYRKEHDLMGIEAEDLIGYDNLTEKELNPFIYPHDKEITKVGVRGIYLNNYIRWDSKKQHEKMIKLYGYETSPQERTFDSYNNVDCFHYSDLHDYVKFLKWGYGKATDHACREIRLKRLSRENGIKLVEKYQNKPLNKANLEMFLKWIEMNKKDFFAEIDKRRNLKAWKKDSKGNWQLTDSIGNHSQEKEKKKWPVKKKENCDFLITPPKKIDTEKSYTLIGRGFID